MITAQLKLKVENNEEAGYLEVQIKAIRIFDNGKFVKQAKFNYKLLEDLAGKKIPITDQEVLSLIL